MSCVDVPKLPTPALPTGLSIPILSFPGIPDIDATLCCHIFIPIPIPPINLGLVLPLPFVEAMNTAIEAMTAYINGPLADFESKLVCPFE